MSDTELRVVCRECGSEVSPYVTECPYCGARVRKRAPDLEHHDDHFEPKLSPRRRLALRLPRLGGTGEAGGLPVVLYILAGAVVAVVAAVADLSLARVGAIAGEIDGEWWRLATAQFAYDNVGYLFAVAIVLAIFGVAIERRLGSVATLLFLVLAGVAGTAGGYALAIALEADGPLIAGGNSVALASVMTWLIVRRSEDRRRIAGIDQPDLIGVGVVVGALLLLPLAEPSADVFAGLAGAVFGLLAGALLAALRRG